MSGWGWMHGYTNIENTVIVQGRHRQKETERVKHRQKRKQENKHNADWRPYKLLSAALLHTFEPRISTKDPLNPTQTQLHSSKKCYTQHTHTQKQQNS